MTDFIWWFNLLFPVVMIVSPLAMALLVRPNPRAGARPPAWRQRLALLVLATLGGLAIFAVAWMFNPRMAQFAWFLFFPIFFGFASPVIAARNPDWSGPHAGAPVQRTASLVPRDDEPVVTPTMWCVAGVLAFMSLLAIVLRAVSAELEGRDLVRWGVAAGTFLLTAATTFTVLPWVLRAMRREPEPLDAGASLALAEAYARHRRFKALAAYWLFAIVMNMLVGLGCAFLAWGGVEGAINKAVAIGGGALGSLVGIAGAVVGLLAARQRVQINALRRELDANAQRLGSA